MKAVIQAGGKGTRVSSITGGVIPKPMLEVDGYPILYHQIMNLKKCGINDIYIIVGYLGEVIKNYFKDGTDIGVNIKYVDEDQENPLGTAGALYYLKDEIKEDFIFLLADVFIDIDFNKMHDFHRDNNADITLLTHPNNHPFDSDLVIECDNVVTGFDSKNNDRTEYYYKNLVNAGIMIFSNIVFNYVNKLDKYNYEKDIVIPLISDGKVVSYKSSEYAKDMGTPERYQSVINDFKSKTCEKKNLSNKQKAIFLDRDGTINKYVGLLKNVEEFELIDGVTDAIKMINKSGYLCIVVTNQPVIARGDTSVEELNKIHNKMETFLGKEGAYIDDIYYCPHHPDSGFEGEVKELKIKCDCRKPEIGNILKAKERYNIDLESSVYIGDTTMDIMTAKNAGMKSILVKTGLAGSDNKYDIKADFEANDLKDAVEVFLKKG